MLKNKRTLSGSLVSRPQAFGAIAAAATSAVILLGGSRALGQDAATASARALVEQQHAQDVFEPLPNLNARLVRHKQSGMLCLFTDGTTATLEVFKGSAKRGDDVGCSQKQANGSELAMFATRMPSAAPEQAVGSVVRSMSKWGGWASPPQIDSHPEISAKQVEAGSWPRAQTAYRGQLNGRPTFVRLAAATSPDGWLITERLVVPLDAQGGDPERLKADAHVKGEVIFSETLRVMAEERKKQAK